MAVFKRYKGKRISPDDPNWHKARWWMEFRLQGHYVLESVVGARTKAQAERAESTTREDIYNRRYNKATATAKLAILWMSSSCRGPKQQTFVRGR